MGFLNNIEIALANASIKIFNSVVKEVLYKEFNLDLNPSTVVNLGDTPGSDKTRKGTPDIYFIEDEKYVYVEITSQKSNLYKKINRDIESCIKQIKDTEIGKIKQLIYISNGKIDSRKMVEYNKLLSDYTFENVSFLFWGLDKLSILLSTKYDYLAAQYLGLDDLVSPLSNLNDILETNYFDTPQTYEFQFRDNEYKSSRDVLRKDRVLLLHGNPGSGKTRLAIELAKGMIRDKEVKQAYIFRRESIFTLSKINNIDNEKCIIILDDINRMPSWPDFIEYTFHNKNIKIIMTVRDYAIESIKANLNRYNLSHMVHLENVISMDKDQIKEVIKNEVPGVKDDMLDEIISRSKNNLRFAIMTTEIIKNDKVLPETTEDVFDHYFTQVNADIRIFGNDFHAKQNKNMKILALISMLGKIVYDYENDDFFPRVFEEFEIDKDSYLEAARFWEQKEVVNILLSGKMIELSDQILGDYIFYKVVFKDKILDISKIIQFMIKFNKKRLVDLFQSILSMYGYSDLIKDSIEKTWKVIENIGTLEHKIEYLEVFSQLLHDETILFFNENYLNIPLEKFVILSTFEGYESYKLSNDILFKKYENIEQKMHKDFYQIIEKNFWIKQHSHLYKYRSQLYLLDSIEILCDKSMRVTSDLVEVIKKFMNYSIEWNSWDNYKTFTIHTLKLTGNRYIYKLRKRLIDLLFVLYTKSPSVVRTVMKNTQYNYDEIYGGKINAKDRESIIQNIEKLNYTSFSDVAFIVDMIFTFLKEEDLEKYKNSHVDDIFNTEISRIYYLHKMNYLRFYSEDDKTQLIEIFDSVQNKQDYISYLIQFNEFSLFDKWVLSNIIELYLEYLSLKDIDISVIFKEILQSFKGIQIQPLGILRIMSDEIPLSELYHLIKNSQLVEKDMWLIQLFTILKFEEINDKLYDELIQLCVNRYIVNTPKSSWGNERLSSLYNFELYKKGFIKHIFVEILKNLNNGHSNGFSFVKDFYRFRNGYFVESLRINEEILENLFDSGKESIFYELYFKVLSSDIRNFHDELFIVYLMKRDIKYVYLYFKIKLEKRSTNINFRFLNQLSNKVIVVKNIIKNHIDTYKYFLSYSIKSIFSILTDYEILEVMESLFTIYSKDRKRLLRIVELFVNFNDSLQIKLNIKLIDVGIDIEIYSKLPLFWGPSSWSGSRIPILIKQKDIAASVLSELNWNQKDIPYIQIIKKRIKGLSDNIKNEELYDHSRDIG